MWWREWRRTDPDESEPSDPHIAAIAAPVGDVGTFAHVAIMIDRGADVDDGEIVDPRLGIATPRPMRAVADTTAFGPIAFERAWPTSLPMILVPSSWSMLIDLPTPPVGETDPALLEPRRRSAIEAVIGHMKAEGHLGRCYLKARVGDAAHVILCGISIP